MSCEFNNLCKVEDCSQTACDWRASMIDLLKNSRLPKYQWEHRILYPDNDKDVESFEALADIANNIERIVREPGHKNLVICSRFVGNGKTTWAIKLMQRYFASIAHKCYMKDNIRGVFIPTNQFVLDAKDFNGQYRDRYYEYCALADRADIVIWDDIGAADYTRYDYTNLLVAIDRRIFAGKYNIFTTNFVSKTDEFVERVGSRLADRIWETSDIVQIHSKGLRGC